MNRTLDLNCDMGEGFGAWHMGDDEALMPLVTSANIACGGHAGDPGTMRRTVAEALRHGVAIGAHPSLPDLAGFGRRVMHVSPQEAYDFMVVQIGGLAAVAASQGARLHHVKAHGALYNMAARDEALAAAIARAVYDVDPTLLLYAPSGSAMTRQAQSLGLESVGEVFADRRYTEEGTLVPRSDARAMIVDEQESLAQVLQMLEQGTVTSVAGSLVPIRAQTLCIHGDQPGAVTFARTLREALQARGVQLEAP